PVVASPGLRPFEIAGADVLHLVLVADEGVAVDAVAFGTGVVDADAAVLEMVVGQLVHVGVVDEHALFGPHDDVAVDDGVVRGVQHQALVRAVDGDVVAHGQAAGEHDGVADLVAARYIAADLAVVGVHVVHRVAQVVEDVAAEYVFAAVVGEDPVAAFGNVVVQHLGAGCVPDGHAIAALVHAQPGVADDAVAFHQGIARTPEIDADGIVDDVVFRDAGAGGGLVEKDARVHVGQAQARVADGQVAQGDVLGLDPDGAARALAQDAGAAVGRPLKGQGLVDDQVAGIVARRQVQDVARRRRRDRGPQVGTRRHVDHGGAHRPVGGDQDRQPCGKRDRGGRTTHGHQAFLGLTYIWPDISMCSAWQNHW